VFKRGIDREEEKKEGKGRKQERGERNTKRKAVHEKSKKGTEN